MTPHQRGPSQIVHRTEKVRSANATRARNTKAATARAPFDPVSLVMIAEPDEVCVNLARLSPPRAHAGASLAPETPTPIAVAPPRDGVTAAAIAGGIRAVAAASSPRGAEGTGEALSL